MKNKLPIPHVRFTPLAWLMAALAVGIAIGRLHWSKSKVTQQDAGAYTFMQNVTFTRALIRRNFYRHISDRTLMDAAIRGMLSQLDPYSVYFPHRQWSDFNEQVQGQFAGIGIVAVDSAKSGVVVLRPLANSPAYKDGIRTGDKIIAVNGQRIVGWSFKRVLHAMNGTVGTFLTLTLLPPLAHHTLHVTARRTLLTQQSVQGFKRLANGNWDYLINPARRIAYVHITAFEKDTPRQLDAALLPLIHAPGGLHGLILDLRFNPGGLVASGVGVARRFIKSGLIAYARGRMPHTDWSEVSHGRHAYPYFPMVVLINNQTASAAELLTGALQCHRRALVVGTQSFGKGCMQNMFPLPGGRSAIKLTTALYYLPDGKNIARHRKSKAWGIEPSPSGLVPTTKKMESAIFVHMKEAELIPPAGTRARQAAYRLLGIKPPPAHFVDPQLAKALVILSDRQLAAAKSPSTAAAPLPSSADNKKNRR
jgi:carboxyl-terminal processing protease